MKLKCQPEDFRVEELPLVTPAGRSVHVLPPDQAKHRHDRSRRSDLPAMESGRPPRQLRRTERPACRHDPVPDDRRRAAQSRSTARTSSSSPGTTRRIPTARNTFAAIGSIRPPRPEPGLTVRRASSEISALLGDGLPNYFDDQRFGSVGYSGQFIGHAWLIGDHERALELALAEANPFDRSGSQGSKGHPARILGTVDRGEGSARTIVRPAAS